MALLCSVFSPPDRPDNIVYVLNITYVTTA